MSRDVEMGHETSALGVERTVEQQRFDAVMIMEVLDVPHVRHAQRDMGMQIRGAVCRHVQTLSTSDGGCSNPRGVAPTASHVDLEAVHGARGHHVSKVGLVIAVLSCSNIDVECVPDESQADEIVR